MSLPAALRVNANLNFPATVRGSGPVTIAKANGIWTVGFTIAQLAPMPAGDPATRLVLIYDLTTQTFMQTTISNLIATATSGLRIVTAAGAVVIVATDQTILVNKTVGAATDINLPTSASRAGVPVIVKDYKGDAGTNNIRFVANGVETLDGLSQAAADAIGLTKITMGYGTRGAYPLSAGGWYFR